VTAIYLIGLWPTWWIRDAVLRAAGFPAYSGLWKLLPHLLLYSTLAAIASAVTWIAFARLGLMEPPPFGRGQRLFSLTAIGGLGAIALVLVVLVAAGQTAAIGWKRPDPWLIAGNAASNFFEEFIFRGFLLAALAVVIRFWPAALVTSALWAAMHTQFPFFMRVTVFAVGVLFAWVLRRSKTIWAPWAAHMLMDAVLDSLIA
jgi:membrane protease YdiL (CAAX protease family)